MAGQRESRPLVQGLSSRSSAVPLCAAGVRFTTISLYEGESASNADTLRCPLVLTPSPFGSTSVSYVLVSIFDAYIAAVVYLRHHRRASVFQVAGGGCFTWQAARRVAQSALMAKSHGLACAGSLCVSVGRFHKLMIATFVDSLGFSAYAHTRRIVLC